MQGTLTAPNAQAAEHIDAVMLGNARMSAQQRLGIYQSGYYLRITACMRDQFPALCYALGEPLFNQFVAEYIRSFPPESYTLYDLGRRFAGFLQGTRPDKNEETSEIWIDFMIDLARFERVLFTTFDSASVELDTLATDSTPDAQLTLQPNLQLHSFGFDVAGYYHDVRADAAPMVPDPAPTHIAILRRADMTNTLPLRPEHAALLDAMHGGGALIEALRTIAQATKREFQDVLLAWQQAPQLRADWIAAGVFTDSQKT